MRMKMARWSFKHRFSILHLLRFRHPRFCLNTTTRTKRRKGQWKWRITRKKKTCTTLSYETGKQRNELPQGRLQETASRKTTTKAEESNKEREEEFSKLNLYRTSPTSQEYQKATKTTENIKPQKRSQSQETASDSKRTWKQQNQSPRQRRREKKEICTTEHQLASMHQHPPSNLLLQPIHPTSFARINLTLSLPPSNYVQSSFTTQRNHPCIPTSNFRSQSLQTRLGEKSKRDEASSMRMQQRLEQEKHKRLERIPISQS